MLARSIPIARAMTDTLIAEDFEALAGSPITLAREGASLAVELKEVRRLASPSPRPAPPFVAVFCERGAKRAWPQGVYAIDLGAGRGHADVFVVPIGPDGEGMCYEAVFN